MIGIPADEVKIERRTTFNDIIEVKFKGYCFIAPTPRMAEMLNSDDIPVDIWYQGKGIVGTANYSRDHRNILFDTTLGQFLVSSDLIRELIYPQSSGYNNTESESTTPIHYAKESDKELSSEHLQKLSPAEYVLLNCDSQIKVAENQIFHIGTYCTQYL